CAGCCGADEGADPRQGRRGARRERADGHPLLAAGPDRGVSEREDRVRRAAAGVAVVVTAGCWLSTAVHPAVAAVVVTTVLVLSTRRALRMATLRRQTTGPLVDILHRSLGVNVTLKVSPAFRAMVPRRYGRLSTPVRWLGDR